ncbi:MAG: hypothetical protein WC052_04535 [Patescibacteria group bacterium]
MSSNHHSVVKWEPDYEACAFGITLVAQDNEMPIILAIPVAGATPKTVEGGRLSFRRGYEMPRRAPTRGTLVITCEMGNASYAPGTHPFDAIETPTLDVSKQLPEITNAVGRSAKDLTPSEKILIETAIPSYSTLPDEKWCQIGSLDQQFVVQLKFIKMAPITLGPGKISMYAVSYAVVNAAPPFAEHMGIANCRETLLAAYCPEPQTDKDKIMQI